MFVASRLSQVDALSHRFQVLLGAAAVPPAPHRPRPCRTPQQSKRHRVLGGDPPLLIFEDIMVGVESIRKALLSGEIASRLGTWRDTWVSPGPAICSVVLGPRRRAAP